MLENPTAVLVLAGGEGVRLGGPKAWLPWREGPLLLEIVRRLGTLSSAGVVVSARPGQSLPEGPYVRVDDEISDAGPLAGLAAGLTAIATQAPRARVAVAACDYPFTDPALFLALASQGAEEVVLPRWGGHLHPLQAVWSAQLGHACARALHRGQRRLDAVIQAIPARIVEAETLSGIDLARALFNMNDAEALARARMLAG
jgi:molybdopterin-guanine dinucleotide biosynthesis protein A